MKLAKARIKPRDQRPEWANCCDAMKADQDSLGSVVVDLDRIYLMDGSCDWCRFCGKVAVPRGTQDVLIVKGNRTGTAVPFPLIDIDEGMTA